ncbi:glycerate dehydrogenase [Paraburkholderia fungorum]|uniref:Glycerate dehydrogenase n=1 Tax=Paraburkholderia fungorum TaxID=134537 RepID=A0AAU8STI8_9BURK|nr:D-2-hydroxyacid dehydrogenase [Paraburkholderia fungorum]AJZ57062.1 glycerate dehydrogenase [Paraburkholderia fungorum]
MSVKHNVVFLDRASVDARVRRPAFAHDWTEHARTDSAEVVTRLRGATIAITNKVPLRAATLEQLPGLKMIAVAATGTDILDLDACRTRGITVSNIRNYAVATLPEHTFAMLLALRRNLFAYRDDVAAGRWQASGTFCLLDHPIRDLAGSRLGIVGFGALGKAVGRLGRAFGMEVCAFDPLPFESEGVQPLSFDDLLASADVISLHLPLTSQTRHLIGAAELARMKPTALLLNTARGGLVDEQALAAALTRGQIGGAGFDVLYGEPPAADNPLLQLRLPNFILTPHIAWASQQAMQTLSDQLIDNVEAFIRGTPNNVVV